MTPFGQAIRRMRTERGISQKKMADSIGVSAAYLSALEHGKRSRPSANLVRQIGDYLGLDWEEQEALERLAQLSHPRVVIDTTGLSARHTELANLLSERFQYFRPEHLDQISKALTTK